MLFSTVCAHAGAVERATITRIEAQSSGRFFVHLSAPISNSPACATQPANVFVVDGKKDGGNVVVALVTLAYTLHAEVHIQGSNACTVAAGFETVFDIYTLEQRPGVYP